MQRKKTTSKKKTASKKKNTSVSPLFARKNNGIIRKKLVCLFAIVMLALVALCIRITYINATEGQQYKQQVLSQSQQKYESRIIPFKRGDILDTNGTVLATSEKVYKIILDCKVVNTVVKKNSKKVTPYVEPTIKAMVEVLGLDEKLIREKLTSEDTKDSPYQIMKINVSITVKKAFEEYTNTKNEELTEEEKAERSNVRGVWFEEDYLRTYPMGSLACDVIGFTYRGNVADWGIEGYYSNTLNGVNGRQYGYYNTNADVEQNIIEPVNGHTVISTLDANIQQIVEKYISILMDGMADGPKGKSGALNVGVIVADPNNGKILAMASNNPYDLNSPRDLSNYYTQAEIADMNDEQTLEALYTLWKNFCISDTFEPGSTVKPLTIAGALQGDSISVDSTYYCDGYEMIGGTRIRCSIYPGKHEIETLSDLIQHSCNDGLMQIANEMGAESFLKYQNIFNFGLSTGIDLPGEATGLLHSKEQLVNGSLELATDSFGQGYTCTMIQEMAAICSVINGGYYYKPQVVNKILDENGNVIDEMEPVVLKQTVSSEISALIRQYMGTACLPDGTGYGAKVDGYSMGGKTGTAQKMPREEKNYLVSYVGFAPLDNPQVAIYTVVDQPNTEYQADGKYSKYLAKMIMSEILPYMNIFPDEELTGKEDPNMLYFQRTLLEQAEAYRNRIASEVTNYNRDEDAQGAINDPSHVDEIPEGANNPELPNPPEDDRELDLNNNQGQHGLTNDEERQQNGN